MFHQAIEGFFPLAFVHFRAEDLNYTFFAFQNYIFFFFYTTPAELLRKS